MSFADTLAGRPGLGGLLAADQAVIDAVPAGIYVCSAEGVVIRANRRASEMLGSALAPGEADERFWRGFRSSDHDGDPASTAPTPMQAVLATGRPAREIEVEFERPDGAHVVVLVNIDPLKGASGHVEGAIACFQDISSQRRAEESLRESERRSRDLLDAIPAALYTTDTEGHITFVNRAAMDLSGRKPELDKDKWCVTWRLHRDDGTRLPHDECPMAVALKEQRPVRGEEIIAERPDGTRVPVMPFPTPLYDAAGKLVGAVNMLVDVSELKNAQQSVLRRMEEQAALYRFTDRLYRAATVGEVHDAALDAIMVALRCRRASILLFDDGGVMRFAAWRGLSSHYREAVKGHSPWKLNEKDPHPICVEDIETADLPDSLKETIKAEGIRALAFIPIVAEGGVIGKFMTYYETPHVFTEAERDLSLTIARQLGFSLERTRAERSRRAAVEALRRNEERLRLATETGKVGIWEWDILENQVTWTDSLFAMHGIRKEDFDGNLEGYRSLVHPDDAERVSRAIERSIGEGAPYELEFRILKADGDVTWVFANAVVLREDGKPVRMLGASFDITERKHAEVERELLLAELSHRVKNTLATVISIAHQSFAKGASMEDARRSFAARIRALAQTHSRLAETNWSGVHFETMLSDEFAPYRREDGGNVTIAGPSIVLSPKHAVVLGMAFHELATNAAKYGALSARNGAVGVTWDVSPPGTELRIRWVESDGPKVEPPAHSGFGRLLLERALQSDLMGKVRLDFAESGLRCEITLPMDENTVRPN